MSKYDTAGWHLIHTDENRALVSGQEGVTLDATNVTGIWKLTADIAAMDLSRNSFARIHDNYSLSSDNWTAGDATNLEANTVYWVKTDRIPVQTVSLTNIALGVTTISAGAAGDSNVENGGELNRNSYIAKFLKTEDTAGDIIYVFKDGYNTDGGTSRTSFPNGLDEFLSIQFEPNEVGDTTIQMKTYSGSPIENTYLYAIFITVNATLDANGIPMDSENFSSSRDRGTYAINNLNDNANEYSIVSFEQDDIQYMNPIIRSEYTNIFLEDSITIITSVE